MRSFSPSATTSLMQRITDEIWIVLLTIDIDGVIYRVVAGDPNQVVSNGNTFEPYAFDVVLPADSLEAVEQVQLVIDNVDRMLVDGLRAAVNPLKFTLQIALRSQPDVIEMELYQLEARTVTFDAQTIKATLVLTDIWNQKFPSVGELYDPQQFPSLF